MSWTRRPSARSSWLAGLLLLAPAACRSGGPPTEPGEATANPDPIGAPVSVVEEPDEGPPVVIEGGEEPASEPAAEPPSEPAAEPPAEAATTTAAATKPAKGSAPAALPAPIFGKGNPSCGRDPGVGQSIKSFSLPLTTGKTITAANLKGRVVLLNFWGTWCKPCLKELPEFDRLYRRYRAHGLVTLAIATDSDPEPVIAFAKDHRLALKLATGGEELANSYQSPNFPFSFVVDENGIIQASYRGFKPECLGQLEADIRGQLAAK